jgi:glycosyltransferase involved in cell wall biosynthesis
VITTETGGIGEAVGDTAMIIPVGEPRAIAEALDRVVYDLTERERQERELRARAHAVQFDRAIVLERMLSRVPEQVVRAG